MVVTGFFVLCMYGRKKYKFTGAYGILLQRGTVNS